MNKKAVAAAVFLICVGATQGADKERNHQQSANRRCERMELAEWGCQSWPFDSR
jgi:hypothetical protein